MFLQFSALYAHPYTYLPISSLGLWIDTHIQFYNLMILNLLWSLHIN